MDQQPKEVREWTIAVNDPEPGDPTDNAKFLYVTNLDPQTDDMEVYFAFARFGSVRSSAVQRHTVGTGPARVVQAKVLFFDPAATDIALAEMNGRPFRGRPLKVSLQAPPGVPQ